MPAGYIPLLLFSLLVLSFPTITLIVIKYLRPGSRSGPAKFQPYESGIQPETVARGSYFERFYIIAMLFVVFEVAIIFLFPWAVLFRSWLAAHLAAFALFSLFVFLGILLVGYVWLYKKGALDVS
jgi:NADH-quinone oxidoreductase subunit A